MKIRLLAYAVGLCLGGGGLAVASSEVVNNPYGKIDQGVHTISVTSDSLETRVKRNTSDIADNKDDIKQNTDDIELNRNSIQVNTQSIAKNTTDIATNASGIATNKRDITTNANNITVNRSNITTNRNNISRNTSDIATLKSDVSRNTSNINRNTLDIRDNSNDIASNRRDINENTSDIATNRRDINENTSDIASNRNLINTNTSNIATNRNNISKNAGNIASNDSDINSLKNRMNTAERDIDYLQNDVAAIESDIRDLNNEDDKLWDAIDSGGDTGGGDIGWVNVYTGTGKNSISLPNKEVSEYLVAYSYEKTTNPNGYYTSQNVEVKVLPGKKITASVSAGSCGGATGASISSTPFNKGQTVTVASSAEGTIGFCGSGSVVKASIRNMKITKVSYYGQK
ncbi:MULTISPECIES: hypothetical protein [Vibrio]|uniref:hypothetical protein n=1 Tax=Vibrio TaxID=662 RepID=UPI000841279C|nr:MULTISPECIES: hypothetical protein [Vibrio]ODM56962.1 hypothetical protein BC455_17880 [Vibrio harveyi]USD58435.1 hypothetical protein J4N44_27465 [Vibrio sp. SCSIO 43155]